MNRRIQAVKTAVAKLTMTSGVALVLFFSGCAANPNHELPESNDYRAGIDAEAVGDFYLARQYYQKALTQVRSRKMGTVAEATCLYNWSRVTGYLRNYEEAEQGFFEVLALIDQAGGTLEQLRPPTLTELARLLHDTRQHAKAVPVYELAIFELQKVKLQMSDPIAFAEFLEEYSQSLLAAGLAPEATAVAQRAAAMRKDYPGATPQLRPRRY